MSKRSSTPGTSRNRDIPLRRSMTQPSSLLHSKNVSTNISSDPQAVVNDENAPPVKKALSQTFNPSQKTSQARKSSVLQPLNRNVQEIPPSNSEPKVSKVPPLKRTNSASNIPSQSISRAHHESAKKINLTKLKGASSYRKRPLVEKTIMYKTLEEIATSSVPKFHLHKKTHLLKSIHDNIFGSETFFKTPFGLEKFLPFVYCDTVQEGKPLKFIEDYLHEQVLPTFGNPNARTNSFLSYQSNQFVTDARAMIAKSLNANIENISNETKPSDTDAMFFTRNSCADAIRLFCDRIGLSAICKSVKLEKERPVILVSPNEHKENIQAWKETGSEVVLVANDKHGNFVIDELIMMLKRYKYLSSKLIVVSVNMVSPITGVCLEENEILSWSHEYGALCFLNYEFASSYLTIDFNHSTTDSKLQKDALYVDASKLIGGGVNCPGILLMRQKLMTNSTCHPMETPKDVLSLIRAALVLKLKDDVGASVIQRMTQRYTDRALKVWSNNSNLMLLGTNRTSMEEGKIKKVSIFSFLIKHQDQYLHPGFVCMLLNDLFGIQTHSYVCEDLHGQQLLGIAPEKMKEIEDTIKGLCTSVKLTQLTPGWTTLQLHYFFDDSTVDFVVKAVDFIANNGWKFLPFYVFNEKNNEWNHRKFDKLVNPVRLSGLFHDNFSNHLNAHRKKLTDVTFSNGTLEFASSNGELHDTETANVIFNYNSILSSAESLMREASNNLFALYLNIDLELKLLFGNEDYAQRKQFEHLRWFCLPSEALMDLKGISRVKNPNGPVFTPVTLSKLLETQPSQKQQ